MANIKNAAVYVGTYRKYNEGSLFGEWITLSDFASYDEFMDYCRQLHSDENDPEFMYQDFEELPESCYSESYISPDVWAFLEAMEDLTDDQAEIFGEWMNYHCYNFDDFDAAELVEKFNDEYCGDYSNGYIDPLKNYADEWAADILGVSSSDYERICNYIDLDAIARDLNYDGYFEIDGHVFRPTA